MPEVRNFTQGAPEKKQNQVRMFQWRQDRDIWRLKCADGACAAMVYERPDRMWVAAIEIPMCPAGATGIQFLRANSATAKADIDQWFREAARVADECSISASVADADGNPVEIRKAVGE